MTHYDTRIDHVALRNRYWIIPQTELVLRTNGGRVFLTHLAKVLEAKKLESFNQENYHGHSVESYPAQSTTRREILRRRREACRGNRPLGSPR